MTRKKDKKLVLNILKYFYDRKVKFLFTDLNSAELIKYTVNASLTLKVTFINKISNLSEKCNANIKDITYGIGLDKKISKYFLNVGPGYGGSCFPKDTKSLLHFSKLYGVKLSIVKTLIKSNSNRTILMFKKINKYIKYEKNPIITILGLTFKKDTDDIRESPLIKIIELILKKYNSIKINIFDPKGIENTRMYFKKENRIFYYNNMYDAFLDSNLIIITTE